MTRLTLESALQQRLLELREPFEICDSLGRVVARVLPVGDTQAPKRTKPGNPNSLKKSYGKQSNRQSGIPQRKSARTGRDSDR